MDSVQKPDLVRQEYKKFKRKQPPPDFSDVIDIRSSELLENFNNRVITEKLRPTKDYSTDACNVGLKNPSDWDVFLIKRCPGFRIIRNPFFPAAQKYWCHKALTEYAKTPYPSNLDIHVKAEEREDLWKTTNEKDSSPSTLIEKLRWTHLGYHFDYNFVSYKEEKYYGFPEDLALLFEIIAKIIGYDSYVPETAIVNYYPIGSSMGGHTDHYEEELDAPLLSISFGQPCIFLIGGPTKDVKPEAIWIRSGDIAVMAGESRIAYHAVPCIVKEGVKEVPPKPLQCLDLVDKMTEKITSEIENETGDNCYCGSTNFQEHLWTLWSIGRKEWEPFAKYLSNTRININVRQVHKI